MSARPQSEGSFARAIEQALARARGSTAVLSPRDFRYVSDWHARGIPLALILESIEDAAAPRRGRTKGPRKVTLAYIAPAVEEAWGVVLSGRTVEAKPRSVDADARRLRWAEAARAAGEVTPYGRLLAKLARRLEQGEDPGAIDLAFDEAVAAAAPAEALQAVEQRVDAELAGYAAKMSPSALLATRRRAIVDRLRAHLELPRVSGGRR